MSAWSSLVRELSEWRAAGLRATFWLRDDDAVKASPELDRLLKAIQRIPLALAAVPSRTDHTLVATLRDAGNVSVWQHGWSHRNWSGEVPSEYPSSRNPREVAAELSHGKEILHRLFGAQAQAVFVPPWSSFAPEYIPMLRKLGFLALSAASPRRAKKLSGVPIINGHVEPIEWGPTPTFADDEIYLCQIIDHLRGRRTFLHDYTEPTGLIWHHQCQNDKSYEFIHKFIDVIAAHSAAVWVDPVASFRPSRDKPFARVGKRLIRKTA